jgi:hypothetical protein
MTTKTLSFILDIPDGLDARVIAPVFTVHCSHCGKPYEGEFGPVRFLAEELLKLSDYALDESDWYVNLDGLYSDEIGDRKAACSTCLHAGWCEICDQEIRAWQHVTHAADIGVVHDGCVKSEGAN